MGLRWPRQALALVSALLLLAACGNAALPAAPPARRPSASPFALRGVVEGFYGPAWSDAATRGALAFLGAHGMNTFVYAPKFDPYQRARWQAPYPPARLAQLRSLVRAATAAGVDFVYSLSPGLSITYSSPADRRALLAKLQQLRGIGVHAFMLSFDDIGAGKLDAADAQAYPGGLAQAQVSLTNAVFAAERAADPALTLMFTPTQYWGMRSDAYTRELAHLAPAIQVVWTGPGVVSPEVTAAQARAFGAIVGRKPLLWYNYPVNDWTVPQAEFSTPAAMQPRDLFLGPVRGLAPDLASAVAGVLSNPMLQAHASQIPLASLAAYLNNPQGGASAAPTGASGVPSVPAPVQAAWAAQVAAAGGPARQALQAFCQAEEPYPTVSASGRYGWSSTDPSADALERQLLAAYAHNPAAAMGGPAAATLVRTFTTWMLGPVQLAPNRLADPALGREIAPWVAWMPRDGEAGLDAIHLLSAQARGETPIRNLVLAAVLQDERTLASQPVQFGGNLVAFLRGAVAAVGGPGA